MCNETNNEEVARVSALVSHGIRIEQTMTTPTRPGKKPRPIWVVSGNTFGLDEFFRDIGGRKYRGTWSFFEAPSGEIIEHLAAHGRNSYSDQVEYRLERKEAKAARYDKYAENTEIRADAAGARAQSIASMIPMGQPLLCGHHSEKRHRRDLERIDSGMRKCVEESKKAEYFSNKVDALRGDVARVRESRSYIGNRVEDATRELASLERQSSATGDAAQNSLLQHRIDQAKEKLDFWQQKLRDAEAEIIVSGGKVAAPETVKVGDEVYFHGWLPVVRVNRKTVTVSNWLGVPTMTYKLEFTRITNLRSKPSV